MRKIIVMLKKNKDLILLYPIIIFPLSILFTSYKYELYGLSIFSLLDFSQILLLSIPSFLQSIPILCIGVACFFLLKKPFRALFFLSYIFIIIVLFLTYYFKLSSSSFIRKSFFIYSSGFLFGMCAHVFFPNEERTAENIPFKIILYILSFFTLFFFFILIPVRLEHKTLKAPICEINEKQVEFLFEGRTFIAFYDKGLRKTILVKKDLVDYISCSNNLF